MDLPHPTASVAVARHRRSLVAYLKANRPPKGRTRDSCYLYDVIFDGRVIVADSKDPECDLARALLAEGHAGIVAMLDAVTGRPRTVINIEKAATLAVEEGRRRGLRFVKWKPMPERMAARETEDA
jgi:hypothetical protein